MRNIHLKLARQAKLLFAGIAGSLLLVHSFLAQIEHAYSLIPWLVSLALILYGSALLMFFPTSTRLMHYAEWLFVALLFLFACIAVIQYQQFYWMFFIPIAAFFLLPINSAVWLTLLLIPVFVYLLLSFAPIFMQAQLFYSFAVISTVSLFLASVKTRTQNLLEPLISKDEETGALLASRMPYDLQKEIARAEREGTGLLLMMMDLEQALNQCNKDKKHDFFLKSAEAINSQLRAFDLYFRLDHHRFAIILPHTTTQDALITTKQIVDVMPECMRKEIMVGYASLNVGDDALSLIQHATQELRYV